MSPANTPAWVPCRVLGLIPASSRASQETSSSSRCCGSIARASRGLIPKNSASKSAASRRKPPARAYDVPGRSGSGSKSPSTSQPRSSGNSEIASPPAATRSQNRRGESAPPGNRQLIPTMTTGSWMRSSTSRKRRRVSRRLVVTNFRYSRSSFSFAIWNHRSWAAPGPVGPQGNQVIRDVLDDLRGPIIEIEMPTGVDLKSKSAVRMLCPVLDFDLGGQGVALPAHSQKGARDPRPRLVTIGLYCLVVAARRRQNHFRQFLIIKQYRVCPAQAAHFGGDALGAAQVHSFGSVRCRPPSARDNQGKERNPGVALKSPGDLEGNNGPHAVTEESDGTLAPRHNRFERAIGELSDVFEVLFITPVLPAGILNRQDLYVRRESSRDRKVVACRTPRVREAY